MTISGIVIHYVGLDCKFPNPLKIHCLNRNCMFNLHDVYRKLTQA